MIALSLLASCRQEHFGTTYCEERLVINEIAAANETRDLIVDALPAGEGEAFCAAHPGEWCCEEPDWIEIYNAGDRPVVVNDFWISVDPVAAKKTFGREEGAPQIEVPKGGYLIVAAIPYDPQPDETACTLALAEAGISVVFGGTDLDRDGWGVQLYNRKGHVCSEIYWPDQHADFAWTRKKDGSEVCVDAVPSPGRRVDDEEIVRNWTSDGGWQCDEF